MMRLWSRLLHWLFVPSFDPQMSEQWRRERLYTSGKE